MLSYQSMEDRMVKAAFARDIRTRRGIVEGDGKRRTDLYGNVITEGRVWTVLDKGTTATKEEVERNNRARSARLRVARFNSGE